MGEGLSQCGNFADKGEGSIFRDFVRTFFMMDSPLGNVQISYDGFLSKFRLPPLYDGILTFSANSLLPYDVFNQPPHPTYTINRERGTVN